MSSNSRLCNLFWYPFMKSEILTRGRYTLNFPNADSSDGSLLAQFDEADFRQISNRYALGDSGLITECHREWSDIGFRTKFGVYILCVCNNTRMTDQNVTKSHSHILTPHTHMNPPCKHAGIHVYRGIENSPNIKNSFFMSFMMSCL